MSLKICSGIIFSILFTFSAYSKNIQTIIDTDSISIGDSIHLTIRLSVPENISIITPDQNEAFGSFYLRQQSEDRRKIPDSDTVAYTFQYLLTTFTPQSCTIPALPYILKTDGVQDTIYSERIPISFISLLPHDISELDVRELKAQQRTGRFPLWWIGLPATLLLIFALIFLTVRLKKSKTEITATPPPPPPYDEALSALKALEGKNLIELGYIKEHVFELSEIFKRYIGRTYNINASEFTTEEMIAWLEISDIDKENKQCARWFFDTTDPVKFARFIPDSSTLNKFSSEVYKFLESTKPQFSSEEKKEEKSLQTQDSKRLSDEV
ncbi:hypothetical protein QA601_06875 [Chitinispirillales bacterium ANBcel5]|uniref:hypothetical protein n=1 Tax=Cellulosispirillum alkaliphilum TaxID=3039283 RepID=UPI002A588333|nr:hypothetical protein [Chitinispirillales bacterium ANBcel5]